MKILKEWKVSISMTDLNSVSASSHISVGGPRPHSRSKYSDTRERSERSANERQVRYCRSSVKLQAETNNSTNQTQLNDLKKTIIHNPEAKKPFCHGKNLIERLWWVICSSMQRGTIPVGDDDTFDTGRRQYPTERLPRNNTSKGSSYIVAS